MNKSCQKSLGCGNFQSRKQMFIILYIHMYIHTICLLICNVQWYLKVCRGVNIYIYIYVIINLVWIWLKTIWKGNVFASIWPKSNKNGFNIFIYFTLIFRTFIYTFHIKYICIIFFKKSWCVLLIVSRDFWEICQCHVCRRPKKCRSVGWRVALKVIVIWLYLLSWENCQNWKELYQNVWM